MDLGEELWIEQDQHDERERTKAQRGEERTLRGRQFRLAPVEKRDEDHRDDHDDPRDPGEIAMRQSRKLEPRRTFTRNLARFEPEQPLQPTAHAPPRPSHHATNNSMIKKIPAPSANQRQISPPDCVDAIPPPKLSPNAIFMSSDSSSDRS